MFPVSLGARCREFESPHSDQQPLKSFDFKGCFLFIAKLIIPYPFEQNYPCFSYYSLLCGVMFGNRRHKNRQDIVEAGVQADRLGIGFRKVGFQGGVLQTLCDFSERSLV